MFRNIKCLLIFHWGHDVSVSLLDYVNLKNGYVLDSFLDGLMDLKRNKNLEILKILEILEISRNFRNLKNIET